ncbi:SLATT domain-containing protein [Salinivibrio kushneri]|uniref:SLATT domain-containing protein n=1 Tax=Salinivibrio kushneri TaxID=1908198 RepID=UPI0022B4F15F|nr:SLATT domain-containing protein [Salinivibrio kushneri]WBA18629.1 SLATT domain-containing protein [Salinivibrio kushneri]
MLSDSIWWTRQTRIRTERRLLSNAFHSQVILFWYSFYSVSVSIYYIDVSSDPNVNKYWLIYSVLVLVVSGFVNGLSYKERAALIKENYEHLKTLYTKAIVLERKGQSCSDLAEEYERALNKCENQAPGDYPEALYDTFHSASDQSKIRPHPTQYQIDIALKNRRYRKICITLLYLLPFLITIILNGDEVIGIVARCVHFF